MEEIKIDSELSERYEGDAEILAQNLLVTKRYGMTGGLTTIEAAYGLIDAVLNMLENGCFCPSCMLAELEPTCEIPTL